MSKLQRNVGQKFSLISAIVTGFLSLPVFGLFLWLYNERGMNDTWTPSALTTIFFLQFCAIVLYVMSRPKPVLPLENTAVDG